MADEVKIVFDPILGAKAEVIKDSKKAGEESGKAFSQGFKGNAKADISSGSLSGLQRLKTAASSALTPLKTIGSLFAAGFAAKGVIDAGAQIERIESQFTTLLGSVGAAQNKVAELSQFAASTPFQLEGISDAAAGLLAFGFEADSLTDRLTKIGDVASGSNSDLKEVGLIYGQIAAAGKLTGERLLQLQERAIPIGKALADSLGVAESEVKGLVSAGKIGFPEFEKAFNSLSQAGGQFAGATARQSQTIGGLLSTLRDNFFFLQAAIAKAFGPAIKESINSTIELFKGFTNFVSANIGVIQESLAQFRKFANTNLLPIFDVLRQLVVGFINVLINAANQLNTVFGPQIRATLVPIINLFRQLGSDGENSTGKIITGFQNLIGFANEYVLPIWEGIRRAATVAFRSIVVGINTIIAGFGKLAGAAGKLIDFFGAGGSISQALQDFSESSAIVLEESITPLNESLGKLFDPIVFEEKTAQFLEILDGTVATATPVIDNFSKKSRKSLESIAKTSINVGKTVSSAMAGAVSGGVETLTKSLILGQKGFGTFAQNVAGIMGDLAIQLGKTFIAAGLAIDATKALSGASAVVAGAALIAVGTILKSYSGGAGAFGGGGGVAAGGFAGGGGGGGEFSPATGFNEQEERQSPETAVQVNISGDVLDSEETGLRLTEILNDAFDKQGVQINRGAIA